MGAIKDIVDLVIELENRITDRKTLDMLLPIKQKIHEAERENFNLEKSHFRIEKELHDKIENLKKNYTEEIEYLKKSHSEEITKVSNESFKLKHQIIELKSKIEKLESNLRKPKPRKRLPIVA